MPDPNPAQRVSSREADDEADERLESETAHSCPECAGAIVRKSDRDEAVCTDCGLIVAERMLDYGPEWRGFTHQERQEKSRVGAPTTNMMHDKGLTTMIDWRNKDASGQMLSSRQRQKMQRLRTWDERFRTRDSRERNLKQALVEIGRMASALGLPESVRETASVIYRRALRNDLLLGRSIEGVSTSALYAACRQEGIPRALDEMAAVSRVERQEIGRTYRYVCRELGLEMNPIDPTKFVPRFCSELGCSEAVQATAIEIIETTAKEGLHAGKSPPGYAGAAIYGASLLCDEKVTQRETAGVAQVSEVTIRNRYQEQLEVMEIHER